jgi:hypothetical protein
MGKNSFQNGEFLHLLCITAGLNLQLISTRWAHQTSHNSMFNARRKWEAISNFEEILRKLNNSLDKGA